LFGRLGGFVFCLFCFSGLMLLVPGGFLMLMTGMFLAGSFSVWPTRSLWATAGRPTSACSPKAQNCYREDCDY
ncbi:MAG: hypothetical protein N2512_04130, partial [Armatimonadetes bacterium]|nr:hypothetical protein [Armatimonadota bacterium]